MFLLFLLLFFFSSRMIIKHELRSNHLKQFPPSDSETSPKWHSHHSMNWNCFSFILFRIHIFFSPETFWSSCHTGFDEMSMNPSEISKSKQKKNDRVPCIDYKSMSESNGHMMNEIILMCARSNVLSQMIRSISLCIILFWFLWTKRRHHRPDLQTLLYSIVLVELSVS